MPTKQYLFKTANSCHFSIFFVSVLTEISDNFYMKKLSLTLCAMKEKIYDDLKFTWMNS